MRAARTGNRGAAGAFRSSAGGDESRAFVRGKEADRDRASLADDGRGDRWDHVAFDPEHRPAPSVVPGRRAEATPVFRVGRRVGSS